MIYLKIAFILSGTAFVIFILIALTTSYIVAIFSGGPFVPTPVKAVKKILALADLKKGDVVYDIGAGDGRFLHYAKKLYGANSIGFEIDPFVYLLGKIKQKLFGWRGKLIRGNFQKHCLSDADCVICYMLPSTLKKYQKKFDKELKEGTKVISYSFHIGSWKPFKIIESSKENKKIFFYKVCKKSKKSTNKKIK